jgi:membrane protease YdiL (CAAX protease family)
MAIDWNVPAVPRRDVPSSIRWAVLAAVVAVTVVAPVAGRWFALRSASDGAGWTAFAAMAIVGFAIVGWAARWDRRSLGLRLRPTPSFRFWLVVGLIGGAVILALALLLLALAHRGGADPFDLGGQRAACSSAARVVQMLVLAPIFEELLYRLVLCTALRWVAGNSAAVLGGGAAFAWPHWYAGVLGPDNLIAGFFFSWAFVRSETLLVPVAFHFVGNWVVIALNDSGLLGPCVPVP